MEQEKTISNIDNPEIIEMIREQFADEWENAVTGSTADVDQEKLDFVERIRKGEKLPRDIELLSKIDKIGQDHGLKPDEIEKLESIFLE